MYVFLKLYSWSVKHKHKDDGLGHAKYSCIRQLLHGEEA